ncbi:binding-protein-dependent transport system inner membrane component domain-containing protein [Ditylenchus destructor]|nr:binding-protein-dependent transport system inner membrane component domain-containing protein [Ditylenchus destructor]
MNAAFNADPAEPSGVDTPAVAAWPAMSRTLPPKLLAGLALSAVLTVLALLSLAWTPWDPAALDLPARLQAPSLAHWLGTDQLGRDLLSQLMRGGATSLGVALVAVAIGAGIGVPLGLWAAARGGWVDELLMRGNDLLFAFPSLLLAVLLSTALGPGALNAILAIGLFNIPVFARLTRSAALPLWQREFVLAARVSGKGALRISAEHVLPNLAGLLLVQLSIQLALGLLAETGLSYLGLGTQPPQPSWGRMLADAQTLTAIAPSLALFPGLAVALSALAFQLLGEGLRQFLHPRQTPTFP